jgi:hypothetical protein
MGLKSPFWSIRKIDKLSESPLRCPGYSFTSIFPEAAEELLARIKLFRLDPLRGRPC